MDIDQDSARVKFPPPLVFLGTLLIGLTLGHVLGDPRVPIPSHNLQNLLGWLGVVLGAALVLSASSLFRQRGTYARPWKTSSALVTDGVYRLTRNPMYLGMALLYAGIALIVDNLVALLLLVPLVFVIQREVIAREEAYLEGKFGERYRTYRDSVRRWI
ncbi:isoprenylcysteine carboxylmethyltransferase family protein [Sphingomonas sp. 7/4-4]|uniref:methyltransferase family protein n=1 Tax=Sphingomonas sp. 7/4-4 TaxID=3018446 RepID=UPI0022F3A577|nr:isoprenylcysteine carboxylmethyltransferase family protein [Sphingomonas sp. 7/4-4]WBY09583.1 isoprenylcysteine carboxylmethyltransferase family protein [Sphingomonas sp. 7/4-4]